MHRDVAHGLGQRGGELLGNTQALGQLSGLTKPLTDAGKAAAAGMVSRGIDSMGDRIKRRTDALRIDGEQAEPDEDEQEEPVAKTPANRAAAPDADEEYDDENADDFEDENEPEEEPPARPRSRQAPGLRRRHAQGDDNNGGGSEARKGAAEGGAPVRRRVSNR